MRELINKLIHKTLCFYYLTLLKYRYDVIITMYEYKNDMKFAGEISGIKRYVPFDSIKYPKYASIELFYKTRDEVDEFEKIFEDVRNGKYTKE